MEYNELVHNMFSTCDTLRHRFDEFRSVDPTSKTFRLGSNPIGIA